MNEISNNIETQTEISDKKIRVISVRISLSEEKLLLEKSNLARQEISTFMRNASLDQKVLTRLTEEDRVYIRQLIGMANNLNQLAKNSHNQSMLSMAQAIIDSLNQINNLINHLKQ